MAVATDARKTGISTALTRLAFSSVAASVTGTVNETTLATITIPAGAMGPNGWVQIDTSWSHTNSANPKTLRVRFGGASGTIYGLGGGTTVATSRDTRTIRNVNSVSSQKSAGVQSMATVFGASTGALVTSSVDTSAAVDIVITGQLANTGETITLESYEVWLMPA